MPPIGFLIAVCLVGQLDVKSKLLAQEQGDWQVDYCFTNHGGSEIHLDPHHLEVRVEGWVSNSKSKGHHHPTESVVHLLGQSGSRAGCQLMKGCREVVSVEWAESEIPHQDNRPPDKPIPSVSVPPNGQLFVRIRVEHDHDIDGLYEPLLGRRNVTIKMGGQTFRDSLATEIAHYDACPKDTWPDPPSELLDFEFYHSPPHSLNLQAGVSQKSYHRLPERKAKQNTKARIQFWYMVAVGTDGNLKFRVAQYSETKNGWAVLEKGAENHELRPSRNWKKFEEVVITQPEATTIAIDFRFAESEVGQAWIDDISLTWEKSPDHSP